MVKGFLKSKRLIRNANLAIKKYDSHINNQNSKKYYSKSSNIENLLCGSLTKYPVIEDDEVFNSLHVIYKKITNYLKSNNSIIIN